jgi:hypothetical protein
MPRRKPKVTRSYQDTARNETNSHKTFVAAQESFRSVCPSPLGWSRMTRWVVAIAKRVPAVVVATESDGERSNRMSVTRLMLFCNMSRVSGPHTKCIPREGETDMSQLLTPRYHIVWSRVETLTNLATDRRSSRVTLRSLRG